MKKINPLAVFYSIIIIFIILLIYFFGPFEHESKRVFFPVITVLGIAFFVLGIWLIFLRKRIKDKKLRIYLFLTGGSAALALICVILHNLVYGLMILLFGEGFWNGGDEAFFFIIALIVCPILLIWGIIGGLIRIRKLEKKK
ncbi:MAG: hypothetical protein ABIH37_00190 [archaeon]